VEGIIFLGKIVAFWKGLVVLLLADFKTRRHRGIQHQKFLTTIHGRTSFDISAFRLQTPISCPVLKHKTATELFLVQNGTQNNKQTNTS